MWLQLLFVLLAIIVGARVGGIGLGTEVTIVLFAVTATKH